MPTTVTRRSLDLAGLDVPVVELTGAQDGPLLTVIAGVHGCEYVPMAAVREWTAWDCCAKCERGGRTWR